MIWTDIYLKFFVNTLNREFIRIEFSIFFLIVNQYLSIIFNLSFLKRITDTNYNPVWKKR